MKELLLLALSCAPETPPETMMSIVAVESGGNPYAIGVKNEALVRQPEHLAEALATARALEAAGHTFAVGLAQINRANHDWLGLTLETAFEPCASLGAGSYVLEDCRRRAARTGATPSEQLPMALSCYYSNNFETGLRPDEGMQTSYAQRVLARMPAARAVVREHAESQSTSR